MSGLCDGRRRVCSSCRQQAFAPRMVRPRRDRAPWSVNLLGLSHLHGPRRDRMKVERPALVRDPHRPIHALFHQHVGRPDIGPHLIELPVMRHRPVRAQAPCGLDAQDTVQIPARRTGPMQIGGLGRLNGEAPIVDRQIPSRNRFAASSVATPARRSSLTSRSCKVLKSRSTRPLAWGEWAGISSTPSSPSARPN